MDAGGLLVAAAAMVALVALLAAGPLRRVPPIRRRLVQALGSALAAAVFDAVDSARDRSPVSYALARGLVLACVLASLVLTVRAVALALRARDDASAAPTRRVERARALLVAVTLLGIAAAVASGAAVRVARVILARDSVDPPGGVP